MGESDDQCPFLMLRIRRMKRGTVDGESKGIGNWGILGDKWWD
jgi:hypothetical protein